jgi:flagellar protein FliO/FliZ
MIARAILALAIVLALMAAMTWVARRYLASGGMAGRFAGKRRLGIVEQTILDGKSRLVLVRRDNTEHLLVLGPSGTVVVESGIRPPVDPLRPEGTPATEAPSTEVRR